MKEGDLRRVLGTLGVQVSQRTHSGWLVAPCPFAPFFHRGGIDRRPSFGAKVNAEGVSGYECHGCHMHGRLSSLARQLGRLRHRDDKHYAAVAATADEADMAVSSVEWTDEPAPRDPPQEPLVEEAFEGVYFPAWEVREARDYLRGRGVGAATAASLDLRWDPKQRRVLFPVRGPGGELYGFSGRAVDPAVKPKVRDYAGLKKRQHVLGAHGWRRDYPLIVVEGLFGLAHLVEVGVREVADVGAILGSELTRQKEDLVVRHGAPTYLLLDGDEAGDQCLFGRPDADGNRDLTGGAAFRLSRNLPTYVPAWPAGKADPDELSLDEVREMLRAPPWVPSRSLTS